MSTNIKVGGTWQSIESAHVKVGGTWQAAESIWVKVSGAWEQVYAAVSYALSGESSITGFESPPPATSYAGVRINADGTIDKRQGVASYIQIDSATDWVIPNSGDKTAVRFRCTDNNANLNVGSDSTGAWLSAPCEWYVTSNGVPSTVNLDLDIEISLDTGTSTHDTGSYTGSATVST